MCAAAVQAGRSKMIFLHFYFIFNGSDSWREREDVSLCFFVSFGDDKRFHVFLRCIYSAFVLLSSFQHFNVSLSLKISACLADTGCRTIARIITDKVKGLDAVGLKIIIKIKKKRKIKRKT